MSDNARKKKEFTLTVSTKKEYMSKLNTADGLGIKLDGSMKFNDICSILDSVKTIKGNPYAKSTILTFMNAFQWKLNDNIENEKIQKLSCEIEIYINQLNTGIRAVIATGELHGNQIKNFVNWEIILEIYEEVKYLRNINQYYYKNYLILSLYLLFGGIRRVKDFALMCVVDSFDDITDNTLNYYAKKNNAFVFFNYKTVRTYGTQYFNVPTILNDIIVTYIERYEINKYLLSKNTETNDKKRLSLSSKIISIFKPYIPDKDIGVDILRHSYVNHIMSTVQDLQIRRYIANRMAHSNDMQADYTRKYTKIDIKILKNSDIDDYKRWILKDNEELTLEKTEQLQLNHIKELKKQSNKRATLKKRNAL